jgi:hypothetical protein
VQKSLAMCQGKTVPGAVLLVAVGRSVPGGPPLPLVGGCAGDAVGSVQGLSLRVDTLSSLSLMRSVKWCRKRQMTVYGLCTSAGAAVCVYLASRTPSVRRRGRQAAAAAVLCLVAVCSAALSVLENCPRKILEGSCLVVLDVEQAAEGGPQGGGKLGPAV